MRRKSVVERLGSMVKLRAVLRARDFGAAGGLSSQEVEGCRQLFDFLRDKLSFLERELAAAEDGYARDRTRADYLRKAHGQARASLQHHQSRARQLLACTPEAKRRLERAGIVGATPSATPALIHQAERTVKLVRDLDPAAPELIAWVTLDTEAFAGDLETRIEALDAARHQLDKAAARVEASRSDANFELARAKRFTDWVARSTEGLCRLVGEDRLADRIQGSVRG